MKSKSTIVKASMVQDWSEPGLGSGTESKEKRLGRKFVMAVEPNVGQRASAYAVYCRKAVCNGGGICFRFWGLCAHASLEYKTGKVPRDLVAIQASEPVNCTVPRASVISLQVVVTGFVSVLSLSISSSRCPDRNSTLR